jgi:hypothetical protein
MDSLGIFPPAVVGKAAKVVTIRVVREDFQFETFPIVRRAQRNADQAHRWMKI